MSTPIERACFHESGHCVVALALGARVGSVGFFEDGPETLIVPGTEPRNVEHQIAYIASGFLADRRRNPSDRAWSLRGSTTDRRKAEIAADGPARVNVRRALRLSWRLVAKHWACIVEMAEALKVAGRLDEPDLVRIAKKHGIEVRGAA